MKIRLMGPDSEVPRPGGPWECGGGQTGELGFGGAHDGEIERPREEPWRYSGAQVQGSVIPVPSSLPFPFLRFS